jgi:hypothetical protein
MRLIALALLVVSAVLSQPVLLWSEEYFPGDFSYFSEVIQSSAGDFYIAGFAPDACLFKVNEIGELVWTWGSSRLTFQQMFWVEELVDGTIAATGRCKIPGNDHYLLFAARINLDGSEVWSRVYDVYPSRNNGGYSISEMPNGNLIVCGFCNAVGYMVMCPAYIMCTDPDGNALWDATWGNGNFTNFALRATFSENRINILAHGTDSGTGAPHILWFSEKGAFLGRDRIDELASYYTGQGCPNPDAGFTFPSNAVYTSDPPLYTSITRVDDQGEVIWLVHVVENNLTAGTSVARKSDGSFLYGGYEFIPSDTELTSLSHDDVCDIGVLYLFDSDGSEIWQYTVNDCIRIDGVCETDQGGIIACGGYDKSCLYCFGDSTGIETDPQLIDSYELTGYPNPFNMSLTVQCCLPSETDCAQLSIFDLTGRLIESLYFGQLDEGEHFFRWTPGPDIPLGCYLVELKTESEILIEKYIYLR